MVILMISNYFFILLAYYILKPARDALLLTNVSDQQWPFVYILIAIFTAPFITIYNKASRKTNFNNLITYSTVIIIASLILLKFIMRFQNPLVFFSFYIWVSVLGALITSQFWIFANSVFDASQAKRLFSILAIGGIVGSFAGSQLTTALMDKKGLGFSTEDTLYVAAAFLAGTILLFRVVWKKRYGNQPIVVSKVQKMEDYKGGFWKNLKTIKRSHYLALMVAVAGITVIMSTFVDYQFKVISKQTFPNKEALTGFLATVNGWLAIGSFVLQGFFTNRFLRLVGVTGILLVLPLGQLIGFSSMLLYPAMLSAILLRSAESSIRYSVDKTAKELLFLPVPIEITKRLKAFLDVFMDRWARGLGGVLIVLLTWVVSLLFSNIVFTWPVQILSPLIAQSLSLLAIVLTILWLFLTFPLRREFVNAFRKAIEKRQINPEELRLRVDDPQSLNAIIASLGSRSDRQVVYALTMLDSVDDKELKIPVIPLLEHPSAEVRVNAMKIMLRLGDAKDLPEIEKLLTDPETSIKADAMRFLSTQGDNKMSKLVRGFVSHSDQKLRHAAIACIASYGDESEKALITNELIEELLNYEGKHAEDGRIEIARALGVIEPPESNKYLKRLLDDQSVRVRIAAIKSIGLQRDRDFVPWLIGHLAESELRPHCRKALSLFGTSVVGTLNDYLNDEKLPLKIRRQIPRVMALIPNQDAVNFLIHSLESQNSWLTYDVLKGLNKLRAKSFELKFNEKEIEAALQNETRYYYEILQILNAQNNSASPESQLLKKSLQQRLDANIEKIFRIMGLQYPPKDIYNAYLSITSNRRIERAKGLEFLDNLLNTNAKKYVLPILDEISPETTAQKGNELFNIFIKSEEDGLTALIKGHNVWLKVCAIYNVNDRRSEKLLNLVKDSLNDRDPMVKETARLALNRIGS